MTTRAENKQKIIELSANMYNGEWSAARTLASTVFRKDSTLNLCFPFETLKSIDHLFDIYADLRKSIPDLERRDTIIMSGQADDNTQWVGCCGYYTGVMVFPWLDIPATGRMISMRFHEFYQFEQGKVIQMQAIWDIPELMKQADAWPMAPTLGREWHVPGPASLDGVNTSTFEQAKTDTSLHIVRRMCEELGNYSSGGVKAMNLPKYWHPMCSWYGPSGIGTARGLHGFRHWHQIPFLNALPDRVGDPNGGYLFAENGYVGFTAWPGMHMTVSDDGWLGIVPNGKKISMRSLDFWRVEGNKIRENWVLIDLLSVFDQLGVDVFARMREFNKANNYSAFMDIEL